MNINNPVQPGSVWSVTPRTLTGFGGAITVPSPGDNLSIAASANVAIFPAGSAIWALSVVAQPITNAMYRLGLSLTGVFNNRPGIVTASLGAAYMFSMVTSANGFALTNYGTVAGAYSFVVIQLNP
jgi:hypothetical protein